jgi:hypothetical protein
MRRCRLRHAAVHSVAGVRFTSTRESRVEAVTLGPCEFKGTLIKFKQTIEWTRRREGWLPLRSLGSYVLLWCVKWPRCTEIFLFQWAKKSLNFTQSSLNSTHFRRFYGIINSENSECITQEVITFWDKWDKLSNCFTVKYTYELSHVVDCTCIEDQVVAE